MLENACRILIFFYPIQSASLSIYNYRCLNSVSKSFEIIALRNVVGDSKAKKNQRSISSAATITYNHY